MYLSHKYSHNMPYFPCPVYKYSMVSSLVEQPKARVIRRPCACFVAPSNWSRTPPAVWMEGWWPKNHTREPKGSVFGPDTPKTKSRTLTRFLYQDTIQGNAIRGASTEEMLRKKSTRNFRRLWTFVFVLIRFMREGANSLATRSVVPRWLSFLAEFDEGNCAAGSKKKPEWAGAQTSPHSPPRRRGAISPSRIISKKSEGR